MKKPISFTLAGIAVFISSCSFFLGTPSGGANADGPTVTRVPYSGDFTYDVDTGSTTRDVFFVFSASADKTSAKNPTVAKLSVDGLTLPVPAAPKMPKEFGANATKLEQIADYNRTVLSMARSQGISPVLKSRVNTKGPNFYNVGTDTLSFADINVTTMLPSTCRYDSGNINVAADGGTRRLVIWVENSQWSLTGGKITQTMVTALANKFLASGENNDIYDWLTGILGPEWGPTGSISGYIPATSGEIHIFLSDIEGDNNPNGGIVGYFWSLNNQLNSAITNPKYSGKSAEKLMFVIDSVMYSNDANMDGTAGNGWDPTDDWPLEIYSTLAHEFQHMIHFYQKGFVSGAGDTADAWINEMCSVLAEDLLSDKIGVPGPRGVDPLLGDSGPTNNTNGRIPIFNRYSYLPTKSSDSIWDGGDVRYYSTVYAFGAWAARNYKGAEFLHNVVCSNYTDKEAVERAAATAGATPSDLDSLIARWAVSVMGSNRTDMPFGYKVNSGTWFSSTYGSTTYKLGSIDFFKFINGMGGTGPYFVENSGSMSNLQASSNVYFAAARGLAGKKSFEVSLPAGVLMTVVVK